MLNTPRRLMLLSALLLALVLPLAAHAQETAPSPTDPLIVAQPCAQPGALTMWVWDTNWQTVIQDAIAQWEATYCPGAQVEVIQQPWGEYWNLLRANAASGTLPDVFNMNQTFVNFYQENEVLLNLTPYFAEAGIAADLWPAGMVGPYTVDGELFAGPVNWDTVAVLYNKDLFDAAGVAYPQAGWTWDDFAETARALTNPANDVYGAAAYSQYQAGFGSWIASTGESPALSADRTTCTLTSDDTRRALGFLQGLMNEGVMPTVSVLGGTNADDAFNYFVSGRVAMVTAGSWKLPNAYEQIDFDWAIANLPADPETGLSRSVLHSVGYVASASTTQPDLAANLILYLVSDEGQQYFADAGGVAPANPSPALQQAWLDAFEDGAARNVAAYVNATGESQGVTLFGDVFSTVNEELTVNLFDLGLSVEDATQIACDTMAPFLGQ